MAPRPRAPMYALPELLWLICPALLYWVSRLWLKTHRGEIRDDPVVFALRDRVSLLIGAVCAAIVAFAAVGGGGCTLSPTASWGRCPSAVPAVIHRMADRNASLPSSPRPLLAYGKGRSYGDVGLNNGGDLLITRMLDRGISQSPSSCGSSSE